MHAVNLLLADSVGINGSARDGKSSVLLYPVAPLPF